MMHFAKHRLHARHELAGYANFMHMFELAPRHAESKIPKLLLGFEKQLRKLRACFFAQFFESHIV